MQRGWRGDAGSWRLAYVPRRLGQDACRRLEEGLEAQGSAPLPSA